MNFGTPVPLLIGIILVLFAVFLFFLEKFKPGYKRDSDVIYASLALAAGILNLVDLTGGFLHSAQSVIFTGVFVALALEAINGRTPDNSPKSMGPRDDDRPGRTYRAGFEDNFGAMDDVGNSRRQMRDGRGGRDEYDSRSSAAGRNERDRFLEDRPVRRSSRDEIVDRGSRRSRDSFGDDPAPRSIPERTSASDSRSRNSPPPSRVSRDEFDDGSRSRRRPEPDAQPRRSKRTPSEPAEDYVEFRPVEPIPPKESWGPKD